MGNEAFIAIIAIITSLALMLGDKLIDGIRSEGQALRKSLEEAQDDAAEAKRRALVAEEQADRALRVANDALRTVNDLRSSRPDGGNVR